MVFSDRAKPNPKESRAKDRGIRKNSCTVLADKKGQAKVVEKSLATFSTATAEISATCVVNVPSAPALARPSATVLLARGHQRNSNSIVYPKAAAYRSIATISNVEGRYTPDKMFTTYMLSPRTNTCYGLYMRATVRPNTAAIPSA